MNTAQNNILSICIQTYNLTEMFDKCLNSIFECILVLIYIYIYIYIRDNASDAKLDELFDEYKKKYNNIIFYKQPKNNPFDFFANYGMISRDYKMHFSSLIADTEKIKKSRTERYNGSLHAHVGVTLDYIADIYKEKNSVKITAINEPIIKLTKENKSRNISALKLYYFLIPRRFSQLQKEYREYIKVWKACFDFIKKRPSNTFRKKLLNFFEKTQILALKIFIANYYTSTIYVHLKDKR